MEKIILEIERQIQRLQAAKQLLLDTQESPHLEAEDLPANGAAHVPPVKRGRGRPRKYPRPPVAANLETATT